MIAAAAALCAAFGVSAIIVVLLSRHPAWLPQDAANARSLHRGAVPRAGGLAILAGVAVAIAATPPQLPGSGASWVAAVAAVALISFADDLRGVPAPVRLAVHVAAAVAVALQIVESPVAIAGVAFAIVWGANLFNFMDGSDGLAATMALTGFAAYAAAAALTGTGWAPYAAFAAAALPFLAVNRPPARMFMGDVGAVPLGFLAAALGVAGIARGMWPTWFPLLVFLPFVADASITLAARLVRRERVWQAHRSHYYQRLNTLGAGHRGTLAVFCALMLACSTVALVCLVLAPRAGWLALAIAVAGHLTAFGAIDYHERRNERSTGDHEQPR